MKSTFVTIGIAAAAVIAGLASASADGTKGKPGWIPTGIDVKGCTYYIYTPEGQVKQVCDLTAVKAMVDGYRGVGPSQDRSAPPSGDGQ